MYLDHQSIRWSPLSKLILLLLPFVLLLLLDFLRSRTSSQYSKISDCLKHQRSMDMLSNYWPWFARAFSKSHRNAKTALKNKIPEASMFIEGKNWTDVQQVLKDEKYRMKGEHIWIIPFPFIWAVIDIWQFDKILDLERHIFSSSMKRPRSRLNGWAIRSDIGLETAILHSSSKEITRDLFT